MARTRQARNRDLPPNLYQHHGGYRYRHPQTGKFHPMGFDRQKAIDAARKLNAILIRGNDLVAKIIGGQHRLSECIDIFERDDIPAKGWKPKTAAEYQFVMNRLRKDYGDRDVSGLSVNDCAKMLRDVTDSVRNRIRYRGVLVWLLDCAVAEGWIETNPANVTKKLAAPKRQRERLTVAMYRATWDKAPAWVRNAMDLSLHTLLRRVDVACMRFEDVKGEHLYIVPRKTDSTTYVRLKMRLSPELREIVARCRDTLLSPYIVHKLPERIRKSRDKDHHTQCSPQEISNGFAAARNAAGITGANAPTFHEVRSLGANLYRQAGWALEQIEALMGHASAEMTMVYLEGHEAPWQEVSAGLRL